jgi:hypothetical protein
MNKNELIETLQELDAQLSSNCDLLLIGGAAMILHFGASRATRDVDMLVMHSDLSDLRRAIKIVAQRRDLPEDWINDAAKGFADILPPDFERRLTQLDLSLQHLHLFALGIPEQAAMKIIALREQDLEDLELLLSSIAEADKDVLRSIMRHVNKFRPDWALKMKYFLEERGWVIE